MLRDFKSEQMQPIPLNEAVYKKIHYEKDKIEMCCIDEEGNCKVYSYYDKMIFSVHYLLELHNIYFTLSGSVIIFTI